MIQHREETRQEVEYQHVKTIRLHNKQITDLEEAQLVLLGGIVSQTILKFNR